MGRYLFYNIFVYKIYSDKDDIFVFQSVKKVKSVYEPRGPSGLSLSRFP